MPRPPKPWFRKARQAWFVTIGGVQHNLGPDKKEAYERFYELMRQPAERRVSPQSLAAICDAFLDWVNKHRSPETFEWYRCRLQRFMSRDPDLRVCDLKPYHVQQWVDDYADHSATTRRNNIRAVKRCVRWALQQGYITDDPVAHLAVPGADRRDVVITPDDFDELLSFVPDQAFRHLLVVTWETGCRPQESLRVEARHVDLANSRWVFPRAEAKTKSMPRVVYLTDEARAITERLMECHNHGPLFRNSRGTPWTKDSVGCAFDRLQVRMGARLMQAAGEVISNQEIDRLIPRLNPSKRTAGKDELKSPADLKCEAKRKLTQRRTRHYAPRYSLYMLRHSWATNALQNGVDALTVAILMGHKDPSTLARVYQHLSHNPQHLLEQARRAAG